MTYLPHLRTFALLTLITGTIGAQTQKAPPPTDWQIEAQVQQALAKDNAFKGSSIISGVNKGVVTLTGNVRSESEKALASQDLANIEGVKTVLNNLTIVDNRFHAPAPSTPTGPTGPKVVTLAQGTAIPIRLSDEINTKSAKAGDSFHGTTSAPASHYRASPLFQPVRLSLAESWKPSQQADSPEPLNWQSSL